MKKNELYGFKEGEINQLASLFRKNTKIEKVVLFGSRALGNHKIGSDVDLSLFGNELNLNDILDLSIEIDTLSLPYKFDVVIFNRIEEKQLKDHIERVGIVLFERMN